MAKLALPIERRKATLKSRILQHKVKLAETRENLNRDRHELKGLNPPRPPKDT